MQEQTYRLSTCNTATHALVTQVSTRWGKEVTVWDELVMLHSWCPCVMGKEAATLIHQIKDPFRSTVSETCRASAS